MARLRIEGTEVIIVFQEQEEEEVETGEATTHNNREAKVCTRHPMVTLVISARRKAISRKTVPNGRRYVIMTPVISVVEQAIH